MPLSYIHLESKSNEDAEEEEDAPVDKGGKKKTVGIRTDITFEISDEDDDNSTRTDRMEQDSSNEGGDGGVPVIKGTAGSDATNGRQNPPGIERRWNTQNIPVFHGTNDDDETAGHNSADNNNNWSNFIPSTARWTTERNYFHLPPPRGKVKIFLCCLYIYKCIYVLLYIDHGFRRRFPSSQQPAGVRASNTWTPCVCSSNEPMWKGSNYRRPTSGSYRSISASSSDSLDDKLEKPFGSLSSSEEEYRLK